MRITRSARTSRMDAHERFKRDAQPQASRRRELDPEQQSLAAHFLDHLVFRQRLCQTLAQHCGPWHWRASPRLSDSSTSSVASAGAHGQAVLAEGRCVDDRPAQRSVHRIVDRVAHQYRAHRNQSAAQGLGQHHHVGIDAITMRRQKTSGAIHARLHFVQHQQRSVASA